MIKRMVAVLSIMCIFLMVGCIQSSNQSINTSSGSTNSKVNADMLGSLTGTGLGNKVGKYLSMMDDSDKKELAMILEKQPSGQTKRWYNKKKDIVYAITPTRNHQYTNGSVCREYVTEVYIKNDIKEYYGRACRQEGNWVIVN